MTYLPDRTPLAYQAITTSEQLSGRNIDGAASYVKLVKKTGALGTGAVTEPHGITGMTRLVSVYVGCEDATPQWIPIPNSLMSSAGNVFGLSVSVDATNITFHIGTSWASSNALSTAWVILEYLK